MLIPLQQADNTGQGLPDNFHFSNLENPLLEMPSVVLQWTEVEMMCVKQVIPISQDARRGICF